MLTNGLKLFIKLIQSNDLSFFKKYNDFSDFVKKSTFLPENLGSTLPPYVIGFMNETWKVVSNISIDSEINIDNQDPISVYGFVFNDEQVASEIYDKFSENVADGQSIETIKSSIERSNLEIQGYEEYKENTQLLGEPNTPSGIIKICKNIVGSQDFGLITGETFKNIFDNDLSKELASEENLPSLLKIQKDTNEFWILCTSNKLNTATTLQFAITSILQAINNYKSKFKKYSDEYKQTDQYKQDIELAALQNTDIAKESKARIDKRINKINKKFTIENYNKNLEQKLLSKLKKLEKQKQKIISNIADKRSLLGLDKTADKLNSKIIEQYKLELERIETKISKIKQKMSSLQTKLKQLEIQLAQYKEDLQYMMSLKEQDDETLNLITELKNKIETIEGKEDTSLSTSKRIEKRIAISQVYQYEAEQLKAEFEIKLITIEEISNTTSRKVAVIKFSRTRKIYEQIIKQLLGLSNKIEEENEQVKVLLKLRSEQKTLNDEAQKILRNLESEVGYIIDGKSTIRSITERLFNDESLKQFAKTAEFRIIKSNLVTSLKKIFNSSELINQHLDISKYLIEKVLQQFNISSYDLIG